MTHLKKTVLITGGTGALGSVVAERFFSAGAAVVSSYIHKNDLKRLPASFKKHVVTVRADVTVEKEVTILFRQAIKVLGNIDILINLVGGFLPETPITRVLAKDWELMMNINLKSVFLCSRKFLQKIGNRNYGRIINIAAMPVFKPTAGRGPYAVSKAGVAMITQILGEELKGTGITANAIAPSILKTKSNVISGSREEISKYVDLGEVAETMLFLCSDNAKSINGAVIPMFGGV